MCVRWRLLPMLSQLLLLLRCLHALRPKSTTVASPRGYSQHSQHSHHSQSIPLLQLETLRPKSTTVASPWTQDAFWISFWVGPQVEIDELDARVAEIAECNFTGYLGFNGGGKASPYYPNALRVAKEIELCDKHGLRCVPSLCDVECCGPTNNSNSSCLWLGQTSKNFWGYQLLDESSYPVAGPDSIGSWSRSINAVRPGALQFYNLLGAADYTAFKTLEDYAVYVSTFLAGVKPAVLSMDFYPYFSESPSPCPTSNGDHCRDTKALYGSTLSVLRSAAEAAPNGPIPFWNFFNAMPYDKMHTDPTEAMLRWQAMTSLAYGSSGVMYFCYWSPDHAFSLGGGLIVPQGSAERMTWARGPHWYEAQRLNSMLKIYGGFLLGRRSIGIYRASSNGSAVAPWHVEYKALANASAPDCAIATLSNSGLRNFDKPASWLVGQFDARSAPRWGPPAAERLAVPPTHSVVLLLNNQDENRNAWTTVSWSSFVNTSSILEVDPTHGVLRPFLDDSPWEPGEQIAIDAGGARLLVLQTTGEVPPAPPPAPLPPPKPPPPPPPPIPPLRNSIDTFGYYWAMQDGTGDMNATNGRNCSTKRQEGIGDGDCSWSHANAAFVQNSWKHPQRWSSSAGSWDLSDCSELAYHNVSCIVSVSHVFLAGPSANTTLSNYEEKWKEYLVVMQPVLHNVRAWYPSDEPDLRMPAATLQTIVDTLKRDTPHIDVLITLSNLAVPPNAASRQHFNLSAVPSNADIVTFDMYCDGGVVPAAPPHLAACSSTWREIEAKLDNLAAFAESQPNMKMAVIPDAGTSAFLSVGAAAQSELNDRFLIWCALHERCVAVLPFVGGHWAEVKTTGSVYEHLKAMGDAARAGDWGDTAVGAANRLHCPLGGQLVHIKCVDHGCDDALLPLAGIVPTRCTHAPCNNSGLYIDYGDATTYPPNVTIDNAYSCCKRYSSANLQ